MDDRKELNLNDLDDVTGGISYPPVHRDRFPDMMKPLDLMKDINKKDSPVHDLRETIPDLMKDGETQDQARPSPIDPQIMRPDQIKIKPGRSL